jgi:teichuronic acid exporter
LRDLFYAIAPAMGSAAGMYAAVCGGGWFIDGEVNHSVKLLTMIAIGVLTYACLTLLVNRQGYREVLNLIGR